jgi:transcriptional regulator with XRE-family HTH domain
MNNLAKYRVKKLGLTQRALAKISKISPVTICQLECDPTKRPRYKTMLQIANALDEPISRVFPESTEKETGSICVSEQVLSKSWFAFCKRNKLVKSAYENGKQFIHEFFEGEL